MDIVGTRTHFRRVAGIIYSSQLSGFLDHRATIRPLVNPSQSISFTITRESFGSVLDAACWNWDEKIVMADEVYKQLSKGLRKLANSRPAEVMGTLSPASQSSLSMTTKQSSFAARLITRVCLMSLMSPHRTVLTASASSFTTSRVWRPDLPTSLVSQIFPVVYVNNISL